MSNSKAYCTPAGGTMSEPVKLIKSSDNTYTFSFSSDISSSATVSGSLYVSALSTNSTTTDSYSLYSGDIGDGWNDQIKYGFSKTFTVPSNRNYIEIQITDLIINGSWVGNSGFDYWYVICDSVTLTAPSNFKASQTGQTVNLSWTGSSASGGSGSVIYKLYNASDGTVITSTTATSLSIAASTLGYASCQYKIIAEYGGRSESSNVIWINPQRTSLTAPANPTITVSGRNLVVSFSGGSTGSYGSGSITYHLFYGNQNTGYFETEVAVTPPSSITVPYSYNVQYGFTIIAYYSGAEAQSSTVYKTIAAPSITKQPAITNVSPASGKETTITWSAAQVSNQGIAAVYYQYFVGPTSTYSDSYHIGTTQSLSAAVSQNKILEKCGSSFRGTCYLFVRAYWDDGTENGGWIAPSAVSFVYDPVSLAAPSNLKASQTGTNVTFSWTAAVASGGNGGITYKLFNLSDGVVVTSTTATSVTFAASTLGYANIQWRIIAEYDGHAQNSASIYFEPKAPTLTKPGAPRVTQVGSNVNVSWDVSQGNYGDGLITYYLFIGLADDGLVYSGTKPSALVAPPSYNVELAYFVLAEYSGIEAWSPTVYYSVSKAPPHNTIRYYDGSEWKQAIVYYYNGVNWVECTPYYYDGSSWIQCSY